MRFANLFAIICTTALVTACSGDSNGGFTDGLFSPGGGQFNGPLQGLVIMDGRLVDLSSGSVRTIVPTYDNGDEPLVAAAANGSEFIEVEPDCDYEDFTYIDCLIFRDAQGIESFRYPIDGWALQGRLPGISPDGQWVTVIDVDSQSLLIFDRSGNIVDHSRQRVADAAWTHDGALVYSSGQSIYIVAPSQLTNQPADTLIHTFAESAGKPLHLSVSPDDNRIALSLSLYFSYATQSSTVWTINSNGSDPQPFAKSEPGFQDRVGWPQWSPDGRWILVRQATLLPGHAPGVPGTQTALRSDIANHELGTESDNQINLRAVCFRRPDCREQEIDMLDPHHIMWVASR